MADEYLIIKREECSQCSGLGAFTVHPVNNPSDLTDVRCSCKDGYIETQVSFLDVLKKLRWDERVDDTLLRPRQFEDLRIEDVE